MPTKKEMKLTDLKKKLSEMDDVEIRKLVCNLYKNSDNSDGVFKSISRNQNMRRAEYGLRSYVINAGG